MMCDPFGIYQAKLEELLREMILELKALQNRIKDLEEAVK